MGLRGEMGLQGPKGDTGEKGLQGLVGSQGPQGEPGESFLTGEFEPVLLIRTSIHMPILQGKSYYMKTEEVENPSWNHRVTVETDGQILQIWWLADYGDGSLTITLERVITGENPLEGLRNRHMEGYTKWEVQESGTGQLWILGPGTYEVQIAGYGPRNWVVEFIRYGGIMRTSIGPN